MPSIERLAALALVFAPLSLLSFGGGSAIIPEIQHQTVNAQHWMSGSDFADLFGLSRAAPGPSTLIVALIGWQVAGFAGALVATIAIFLPSSLLGYAVGAWWRRSRSTRLGAAIEQGMAPVAVGLFFAGPLVILTSAHPGWLELATIAAVCLIFQFSRIGPYYVAGAIILFYGMVFAIAGMVH